MATTLEELQIDFAERRSKVIILLKKMWFSLAEW